MELPVLLPSELEYLSVAKSDEKLFEMLCKIPPDLILFFHYACDDQVWVDNHSKFIKNVMEWLSLKTWEDKLFYPFVEMASKAIRRNSSTLAPYIIFNFKVHVEGGDYLVSSFLWQGASPSLKNYIRQECRDKEVMELSLKIPPFALEAFDEYATTGDVRFLYRYEEKDVLNVLRFAEKWEIKGLSEIAQGVLARYIARGNCVQMLIESHLQGWTFLKTSCMNFINGLNVSLNLSASSPKVLCFEFLHFRDDAMNFFHDLKKFITHLVFSDALSEEAQFSSVIHDCPSLVGISLNGSRVFSDRLVDLPSTLHELDLSKCQWLDPLNFKKIVGYCPHLKSLHLASNTQCDYRIFGEIKKLEQLKELDLSQCQQIQGNEWKILLQAGKGLSGLSIGGCTKLDDQAFFELGRQLPNLQELDLTRTAISDEALIDMVGHMNSLYRLNLTRCTRLTEKGVIEAARLCKNLESLNLTDIPLAEGTREKIKLNRPYLVLI